MCTYFLSKIENLSVKNRESVVRKQSNSNINYRKRLRNRQKTL